MSLAGRAKQAGRRAVDHTLSWMSPLWRRDGRLRILGFHDVTNPQRFEAQMAWLARHFRFVGLEDVVAAVESGRPLPEHAVWVTFDDGEPDVIDRGLPVFERYGVKPTLFVCPSVVGTSESLWFQAVRAVKGPGAAELLTDLKQRPRDVRERAVADLRARAPQRRQATIPELRRFVDAGGAVANHTWSHPLLDCLDASEVEHEIRSAHDWLRTHFARQPLGFAYPNGNTSPHAEPVLSALGYRVALLFDHRHGGLNPPLAMSRIRVNSTDTLNRFVASASGAHPALQSLRTR